ncbi:MAG TPA: hypothetical protein VK465_10325 [Fibrobacteria bacterium]|nr:hypothetical protein [Fibrobacteria bacterium]
MEGRQTIADRTPGAHGMGRRDFLATTAALLAGLALSGCSDDESNGTADLAGKVEMVDGHKHDVVLKGSDIEAGVALQLMLTGMGHTHTLDLTADQIKEIKNTGMIHGLRSGVTDGHAHSVHFMRMR